MRKETPNFEHLFLDGISIPEFGFYSVCVYGGWGGVEQISCIRGFILRSLRFPGKPWKHWNAYQINNKCQIFGLIFANLYLILFFD